MDTTVSTEDAIIAALRQCSGHAAFCSEVAATVGDMGAGTGDFETALAHLEEAGSVLVRQHSCGDPHLVGMDFRILGLIESPTPDGGDGLAATVATIESVWHRWVTDFLASHRCT